MNDVCSSLAAENWWNYLNPSWDFLLHTMMPYLAAVCGISCGSLHRYIQKKYMYMYSVCCWTPSHLALFVYRRWQTQTSNLPHVMPTEFSCIVWRTTQRCQRIMLLLYTIWCGPLLYAIQQRTTSYSIQCRAITWCAGIAGWSVIQCRKTRWASHVADLMSEFVTSGRQRVPSVHW